MFKSNALMCAVTLSCRPGNIEPQRLSNWAILFGPDERKCAGLPLTSKEWKCVVGEMEEMDGSFLEIVLKHIIYRCPRNISQHYHVGSNWLGRQMQNRLNSDKITWDALVRWAERALRTKEGDEDTLVVPFNDKSHWSIFVVEQAKTYHLDTLGILHDSQYARDFVVVVHLGWAQARGYEPGSRRWRDLVMQTPVRVACPKQGGVWECGYVACFRFWEYFLWRAGRWSSDEDALTSPTAWQDWPAQLYHRWFLQVLFTELAYPGATYDPPSISISPGDGAAGSSDSETTLLEGSGLNAEKANPEFLGLDALLSERPVCDIQVQSIKYPSMQGAH